jgi:hypothetical protein
VTAAAWTVVVVILAGCAAYAWDVLDGRQRISTAILRARWAWRCRGCPPPGSEVDPLGEREREELITIRRGRRKTARPEKTPT